MGLGLKLSMGLGRGGRVPAVIQELTNGFHAPDSLTTGPLYVDDNTGTLVTAGADKIAVPGARLVGTDWFDTDSEGAELFASQQVRTRNGTVKQYTDPTYKGMMVMPARTNKCTCRKYNPTDTSNITPTGDPAAVLSVVNGSTLIANAGLDSTCTSGMLYKFDNSAGSGDATANFDATGNTNPHSLSVYAALETGSGLLKLSGGAGGENVNFSGAGLVRYIGNNRTPLDSGRKMSIVLFAGSVCYFILPQLEEGSFSTPAIIDPESDPLTTVTRSATVASYNTAGVLRDQNLAIWLRRYVTAAGQTEWALNSYTDASNETGVQFQPTALLLRKRIGGTDYDASVTFTHIEGFNDAQVLLTDKGLCIRASDDRGATWTAWGTPNTNALAAQIASTVQLGRNGSDQLACNETFTATAFIPAQPSIENYQNWVETNAKWAVLGN